MILLYVGISVDDNFYRVGCCCPEGNWGMHFKCKPDSTEVTHMSPIYFHRTLLSTSGMYNAYGKY